MMTLARTPQPPQGGKSTQLTIRFGDAPERGFRIRNTPRAEGP